jgi:hypothetical protein
MLQEQVMHSRIALVLLLLILSPMALAESDTPLQICRVSNIPGGYVIIGVTTVEQCRANADLPERENAWVVKRPGLKEVICEKSPYPGNYAVISRTRSANCPNTTDENYNNAWVIERLK